MKYIVITSLSMTLVGCTMSYYDKHSFEYVYPSGTTTGDAHAVCSSEISVSTINVEGQDLYQITWLKESVVGESYEITAKDGKCRIEVVSTDFKFGQRS